MSLDQRMTMLLSSRSNKDDLGKQALPSSFSYLFSLWLSQAIVVASAFANSRLDTRVIPSRSSRIIGMSFTSGNFDVSSVDKDVQEFHQYAAAAVDLTMVHASLDALSVIRSCRIWDTKQQQRQSYFYRFSLLNDRGGDNMNSSPEAMPPIPLDASVKIYLPSPSGKKTAVVKEETNTEDELSEKKKTIVQVWHGPSLLHRILINENQHGNIINDDSGFGSPVWSPDESCLLYNAERIPPKTEQFWITSRGDEFEVGKGDNTPPLRGGGNVFGVGQREHWGERYSTQEPILDLYILNLETGRVGRIQNVPTRFSSALFSATKEKEEEDRSVTLGQAVWHPSGQGVAFTAWDGGFPKRLGIIYCRNRSSKVMESSVRQLLKSLATRDTARENDDTPEEDFQCCSAGLPYARSPRYIEMAGEARLVFLGSDRAFVSHDACMGLFGVDANGNRDCIVPIVDIPKKDGPRVFGMGFPGLFVGQLPLRCSVEGNSNSYLVTTSLFGSVQRVIRVNCSNGIIDLVEMPQFDETTSQTVRVLSPDGGLVVEVTSSNGPTSLWLVAGESLKREGLDGSVVVDAREIASFGSIAASTYSTVAATCEVPFYIKILVVDPPEVEGATSEPIQAILLLPKTASPANPVPLVVIPHGGPHSCTTSSFVPGFAHMGTKYAVVFPNYRGSIGFGQASVDSLLTRIGHVDVEDVMACTKYAIDNFSELDCDKIGICGGSHGGFLTAHCTSQYPDFFKAAACRNPVTNIASMLTSTDIPDWCFAEAFGLYDQGRFQGPTKDQITAMYEKSPVSRIGNVKTPTLVALGKMNLRVPYTQGLEWFYSLRSNGVPTKLLLYPKDCHALDRDTTEADHWIHIRQWFDEYLS